MNVYEARYVVVGGVRVAPFCVFAVVYRRPSTFFLGNACVEYDTAETNNWDKCSSEGSNVYVEG